MDAVVSLLKIHEVDVQVPLPFSALFNDVAQNEDLGSFLLNLHDESIHIAAKIG